RELADDVERYMADEPVGARPEPILERAGRYLRRRRTMMSTAAAGLLASLIGLGAVAAVQNKANAGLTSANAQLRAANTREQERFQLALEAIKTFHTGVSEDLLMKEKQFDKLRKSLLGRAADFYGKLEVMLKGQNDQRSLAALSDAYAELASLTKTIGSAPRALELSHQSLELARSLHAAARSDADAKLRLLEILIVEGRHQQAIDDFAGALKTLQEGVSVGEELLKIKPSREARIYLSRAHASPASVQIDLSKPEALHSQQRAATILEEIVEANPRDFDAQNALANVHFSRGYLLAFYLNKSDAAIEDLELARKMEKDLAAAEPDHLEYRRVVAEIDGILGILRLNRGETSSAFDVYDEGRQTIEKLV